MRILNESTRLNRFAALNRADRILLCRAVAWLAVARGMLALLPFRSLTARLMRQDTLPQFRIDSAELEQVGYAVAAAAGQVPWRSDCLIQAIAAQRLLRGRGIGSTIHIGVRHNDDEELTGHAWLSCEQLVVVGERDDEEFVVVHELTM